MTTPQSLSRAQARRIALAAQGFADKRPTGRIDARHLTRVLDRVGLFQIDSVNVLVRSHYLPAFARLGAYPAELIEKLAYGRRRQLFEYWGHEASLIPLALQPYLRWRMADAESGRGTYGALQRFRKENRALVDAVEREIRDRGPLGAGEIESASKSRPGWWEWGEAKMALEWLFWAGRITTASRRNF
ncbi:MAG TPA: crosslink repair DNA glycosylase YcaQ family protein, partial [Kiloniellales bacterium]|nr:crosslink repair DNA glycosylase YcaQ family protein [Kiloniellales bacterium]